MACAGNRVRRKLRHRLTVGAVATAGIAGLGLAPVGLAVAATPGSGPAANPVSAAAAALSGSERFTMALSVVAAAPGTTAPGTTRTSFGLTASGVLDNPAGTSHGVGQTPGLAAADLHLHVATLGTFDLRELGGVLYVHLPPTLAAKIPGIAAKPWLAVDLAALRTKLGASASPPSSVATMPGNVLTALGQVATVTKVGTATIRSTPTTEYVADLQLAKLAAVDPALSAAQVAKLEAALPNGTLPIAVWLDAEGRVRQVHLRLVLPVPIRATPATGTGTTSGASGASGTGTAGTGPGGGAGTPVTPTGTVTVSYTMDLFDYGPAATFSVPPPGQVQDVTKELEAVLAARASAGGSASAGGLLGGGLGVSGSSTGTSSTGTSSTGTSSTGSSSGG